MGALALAFVAIALSSGAAILPTDRATIWSPGIQGGIPARTTICATVNATAYGNGSSDASAAIQAALDSCPAGQVVLLSAGTFRIDNDLIVISKGITLRGAGPGSTILKRTNGAHPGVETASVNDPVVVIGPNRWPGPDDTTARALTVDGAKGAYSVTVSNASGFAAGQFVLLDEDNYNTAAWQPLPNRDGQPTPAQIWTTDRAVWQRHNPSAPEDDPFPDAAGWFSRLYRPIAEVKEVASVSGNVITFTTPLHISYRASYAAQLTRYTGQSAHVRNAGLEDLSVYGGGDGNVRFECAAYSWMRNVEDTVWLGEGVAIKHSFRVEVRDSYIHDAAWPNPGGGGYAISLGSGSAEALIENNIVLQANKMMVGRSAGAGSVVGYNYMDDGHIRYNPEWVEVGINGSHMVGSHHILFEGNESFNYDSDNTHGNAIYHTVFRNHLSGYRRDFPGMSNARAGALMYGSWWHSFVGNVMGTQGRTSGWQYEDPGTPWGDFFAIWRLGYDPIHWDQDPDPKVRSTVLREGNYDYVTDQVHWDTVPQTLPDSLYLTSKPAFFGNNPWPWVNPPGATKLYTLPAKARYDSGSFLAGHVHFGASTYSTREGGTVTVLVRREPPTTTAARVSYATSNGTATADTGTPHDYAPTSGTLTFAPGQTMKSFTVATHNNTSVEGARTFLLRLLDPLGGADLGSPSTAAVTILDNDLAGTIQFSVGAYTAREGDAQALIRVTRTGGTASGAAVEFTASGGTATANVQYEPVLAQHVVFGVGQTSQVLTVNLLDDATVGGHKTVNLSLGGPAGGARLGTRSTAVLTILKEVPVLQFGAPNFSAVESLGTAYVAVKRSGLLTDAVSVHVATSPGTATPSVDYEGVSGDLTFASGVTSQVFRVPLVRDGVHEPNRTVLLTLSAPQDLTNPGNAALGQQSTAILTIDDRDATPRFQFGAAAYTVGENAGIAKVVVRRLSGAGRASVDYKTSNGTAQAGSNYDAATGTLTFLPGEVAKTVPVTIHPSAAPVGDLALNLTLSNPRGDFQNPQGVAVLGSPSTTLLTIRSADPLLQFSAPSYRIGEAGTQATIMVRRSGPLNVAVGVDYYDAGGGTATTPQNYSLSPGTLDFPPFVQSRTFTVTVRSDGQVHPDRTVNLALKTPTGGAALGAQKTALLTLMTDDPRVQFTRAAYTVAEASAKATIAVMRTGPASRAFTVPVSATNGTATSANYGPPNPSVLNFGPGVVIRTFTLPIVNDRIDEPPPLTVNLALGSPSQALLGSPQTAVLTIADNDIAGVIQFAVSDYSVSEKDGSAVVTLIRTGGYASGVTVHYTTSGGSAVVGTNYNAASGTVTFAEGQTSQTFTIDVLDDGTASGNKTVNLVLGSPGGGASLGLRSTATLWIVDAP
jgi:hypothetical protein